MKGETQSAVFIWGMVTGMLLTGLLVIIILQNTACFWA